VQFAYLSVKLDKSRVRKEFTKKEMQQVFQDKASGKRAGKGGYCSTQVGFVFRRLFPY